MHTLSRKADIWAECSEGLLPAISTSGGVAAKLRFRVCSGGHAGAYGADVVKDIFWIFKIKPKSQALMLHA